MLSDVVGHQKANEIVIELQDLIETIQQLGWKEIRPWSEFFAVFKPPQWTKQHLEERITTNFLHYRSNYFVLCVGLFILQLLFSPIIIVTAIFIGLFYFGLFTFLKKNLRIGDLIITYQMKQYTFLISSGLLLILSGSLTRLAWMIVSCLVVCGGHMIFRPRNMTAKANKVYEEMKLNGYDIKSVFQFSSSSNHHEGGSSGGGGGGGSSSSAAARVSSTSRASYNNDKPTGAYPSYAAASKTDLEDPVEEDDVPRNTPYSTTPAGYSSNLPDNSGNIRKRNSTDLDFKHK